MNSFEINESRFPFVNVSGYTNNGDAHIWSNIYIDGEWKGVDLTNYDIFKNSAFLSDTNGQIPATIGRLIPSLWAFSIKVIKAFGSKTG